MTELSNKVIKDFVVRQSYEQKSEFIELIKDNYDCSIQEDKKTKSRNLIIGDVNKAKVVYVAHYDTPCVMPLPNFIMPQNVVRYILLMFLVILLLFLPFKVLYYFNIIPSVFRNALELIILTLFYLSSKVGPANKNNFNDNTSGVVALIELMDRLTEDEKKNSAFIFFDNEEKGLYGSKYFRNQYKDLCKELLLVNFDCIGDGNNALLIYNKKSRGQYKQIINKNFTNKELNFLQEKKLQFYPSDQMGFKNNIAVCTLKKNFILGYYIDKIHTKKDTILREENIDYLVNGFSLFQKEISKD